MEKLHCFMRDYVLFAPQICPQRIVNFCSFSINTSCDAAIKEQSCALFAIAALLLQPVVEEGAPQLERLSAPRGSANFTDFKFVIYLKFYDSCLTTKKVTNE